MIKVLVVDDSALMRKLLLQILDAEEDFEVRSARDGLEALESVAQFAPDVVTLDVQMPKLDGLATLDRLMIERPCPVVMLSSLTAEGAEATLEALRLGAVDFLPKPSGAVSLRVDAFGPLLISKIRAAASARIPSSLRLRERLRRRAAGSPRPRARAARVFEDLASPGDRASGTGVVLVGTSTGGPVALEALLAPLPADFPWPILVAQHMPATFTGPLARRLDALCALSVVEVRDFIPLQPGGVYIGRGDADMAVVRSAKGFSVRSEYADPDYLWHPSVDRLVRSAMNHFAGPQLIGVLMTGMGKDGAAAMAELRRSGGRTIAESEDTAVVWGMPGELARLGGADFVLPLHGIAERLRALTP